MDRTASIERYRQQALNAASLITAIASARVDARSRLTELSDRQDDQLLDLLHEFAFRARKLIELADRAGIPVLQVAKERSLPATTTDPRRASEEVEGLVLDSVWFVINKIIHSDSLKIQRSDVQLDGDYADISHRLPWGFEVSSDLDGPGASHFIFIEFLLEAFLHIDELIRRHLSHSKG